MFGKLLLIFIGVPLIEMLILIKLGEVMGFWPTIGLVVVTGILGAALAKVQGLRAWINIQRELSQGKLPANELVDGLFILVAGIVLLTPGLLTDIFGFLLLIPATRNAFKYLVKKKLETMARRQQTNPTYFINSKF